MKSGIFVYRGGMMMKQKDLNIMAHLRANGREQLTALSKKTGIPVSTIFDRLRHYQKGLITRFVPLLNFNVLGYGAWVNVMLKVPKEAREDLKDYLYKHPNVNSLYKINNGFDFQAEVIFKGINELETFMELLDDRFGAKARGVYYIMEGVKRETFMADPQQVLLVVDSPNP